MRAVYQQAKSDESEKDEEESSKQEESAPEKEDKQEEEQPEEPEEDEFEVEAVVDMKKKVRSTIFSKSDLKGSSVEYLVKWRGYPSDQNTWEPAQNLEHCPEMIEVINPFHFILISRNTIKKINQNPKKR